MKLLLLLLLLISPVLAIGQQIDLTRYQTDNLPGKFKLYHYQCDTLFNSQQSVFLAAIPLKNGKCKTLSLVTSEDSLRPTSRLARGEKAILAINGGFFNMKKGGSVAYVEKNGKSVVTRESAGDRWSDEKWLLNGAFIINKNGRIVIEPANQPEEYMRSGKETDLLITGPLLLQGGVNTVLSDKDFIKNRHPRSILFIKGDELFLVAIDGRSSNAAGMSLPEVQKFMHYLGARDAINLDGGGSTTLWYNREGTGKIVNHPSDKTGERPVANCIVLQ